MLLISCANPCSDPKLKVWYGLQPSTETCEGGSAKSGSAKLGMRPTNGHLAQRGEHGARVQVWSITDFVALKKGM